MHTDQGVLRALAERFSVDQLAAVLGRILRIPEAWEALHNPGFLAELLAASPGPQLTPSQLAALALGGSLVEPIQPSLAEPHLDGAERAWQEAEQRFGASRDLFETALLGLEFFRRTAGSDNPASLIELPIRAPEVWRSPLAIIWPHLPDPDSLLAQLIKSDRAELAIQTALSNLPVSEAAITLFRNAGDSSLKLVQAIQANGETELAGFIPEIGFIRLRNPLLASNAKSVDERPDRNHDSDHRLLSEAWQATTSAAALVADLTAAHARIDGDPVTELEAIRHALNLQSTPARRAWAALSLMKLGRFGEAMDTLPRSQPSTEELIAHGLILAQHGESGEAELRAAHARVGTDSPLDEAWFKLLASGLWSSGDRTSAIEVATNRSQHFPANTGARADLSQMLFEAGDSEASRDQSALALALSPSSQAARQQLAVSLQDCGEFAEALSHWKTLASEGAGDPEALVECALRAGDTEAASAAVAKQLDQDPISPAARLVEGRILAASGSVAAGREKIEAAIEAARHTPGPYLALAKLQTETGDPLEAGKTLARGVQAAPGSVEIRAALANWLSSQGRLSEGLEMAASATALDSEHLAAVLAEADLLRHLGHLEQAIANLRRASRSKPLSWRVGLALAEALVARGDFEEAATLAAAVPNSAPPDALLTAGKVGVMAGIKTEAALQALSGAEAAGLSSPDLDFWLGRGLESNGQFGPAIVRFEQALAQLPVELVEIREAATLGVARCALGAGQISLALSTLESALEWFTGSSEILALMSEIYQAASLPEKAIEVARQAVESNQESVAGWCALSKALALSGDYEAAEQTLRELSSRHPTHSAGWLALAEVALRTGNPTVGRRAAAEVAWRGRRNPEVLASLASLLGEHGYRPTALRLLSTGMRFRPDDVRLRRKLAELKEAAGDREGALQAWLSAAEAEPREPGPRVRGAAIAGMMGEFGRAVELLEQAVGLAPRDASARRELARAYLRLGRTESGFSAYEAAMKEQPGDGSLAIEVAEAALQAGAIERVDSLIERARQVVVEPARIYAALGEAHLARNRWDEAGQALEEAIAAGDATVRVLAMKAIVVSRSDLGPANEALIRASQAACKSAPDAIWMSRAQLRRLNWDAALSVLEPWVSDPYAAREKARVLLRIAGACWMFNAVEARASAPRMDEQGLIAAAESLINEFSRQGQEADALLPLRSLLSAARMSARSGEPADPLAPGLTGEQGESMAISLLKGGQSARALEALAKTNPASEWTSLLEGLSHEFAGNPPSARSAYRRCAEDPVLAPIGNFLLGRSYGRAHRPELATSHLNAAVAAWPAEHAWQHALGKHYAELNELDASLAHLQQAAASESSNPAYRLDLARGLRRCGQLAQAEEAFCLVLQSQADSSEALREAAETALELGKVEKAAGWFERARALDPADHRNLIGAARAASERGNQKVASELLAAATRIAPGSADLLMAEGQIRGRGGELEPAVQSFERALEAGAPLTAVRRAQSKLLLERGQTRRAVTALEQAVQADPEDHALWHQLALAREAGAEWGAADDAVREAIKTFPTNTEYRLSSGRIARRAGQLDRAIDELLRAGELAPNDPRIYIESGKVYEDRREYSRALDSYRKAIALDPGALEALYRAGVVLRGLKSYKTAGELLKRAAELAPVNKDVLHQLAAVRALELVHG